MAYIATYDLNKAGQDYVGPCAKIMSLGDIFRSLQKLRLLSTRYNHKTVMDELLKTIDDSDTVFISRIYKLATRSGCR